MSENEITEQLFNLRQIGDYIDNGIFIADAKGTVLYVNSANENNVDIPRDYIVGKNLFDMQNDLSVGKRFDISGTVNALREKRPYASYIDIKDSDTQVLSISVPIVIDGELIGVIVIDKNLEKDLVSVDSLHYARAVALPMEDIPHLYEQLVEQASQPDDAAGFSDWADPAMQALNKTIGIAAQNDVTILITGESGTGKEVAANQICQSGARARQPFIRVNCSAIPEHLLESELFGYEKGAFTGADPKGKAGAFELANHGTILLDEIGDMPLSFQPKLLRAIQQKTITRVGGTKEIRLDIRILVTTNRDLQGMVQNGTFRQDLFYRINVLPINLPPLRARGAEDICHLLDYFLAKFNRQYGKHISLEFDVYYRLARYDWPGNIREMENVVERWCVLFDDFTVVRWRAVSSNFTNTNSLARTDDYEGKVLASLMDDCERDILLWAREKYSTLREMAAALGVDYTTLSRHGKRLGIDFSMKKS